MSNELRRVLELWSSRGNAAGAEALIERVESRLKGDIDTESSVPPGRIRRHVRGRSLWVRGPLRAVVAALVLLLAVGGVALWTRGGGDVSPVVAQPTIPTSEVPVTTEATPNTTTGPTTTVAGSSGSTATGNLRLVAEVLNEPTEAPLAGVYVYKDLALVGGLSVGYHTPENVGVRIVDLSDPENPSLVGRIPLRSLGYFSDHSHGDAIATSLKTAAFTGDVAIVLNGVPDSFEPADYPEPYGLWDITDPTNPEFLSVINLGKSPHGFEGGDIGDKPLDSKAVAGTHFFALYDAEPRTANKCKPSGCDVRMAVVDISDPYNPQVVANWQDNPEVLPLGLTLNQAGTRAYLTGVWPPPYGRSAELGYLYVVDVADPTQPTLIGTYTFPLRDVPSSMVKALPTPDETHVLLLDHSWGNPLGTVLVLDITDLDNIYEVATFGQGDIRTDVAVRGDLAFTVWMGGLPRYGHVRAIDISDPLNPTLVGDFTVEYNNRPWLSDVALYGDRYVVVSTLYEAGLYVLEILDQEPASP